MIEKYFSADKLLNLVVEFAHEKGVTKGWTKKKKKEEEEDDERKGKEEKDKRRGDVYDRERKYQTQINWVVVSIQLYIYPACLFRAAFDSWLLLVAYPTPPCFVLLHALVFISWY